MSIRKKLTILISLLIAAPLLFSAIFWINTLAPALGDLRWKDLILRGRSEVEERAVLRLWSVAVAHNDSVVWALQPIGQRLSRELASLGGRLREAKCLAPTGEFPPSCQSLIREFLDLHPDLEGLLAYSGTRFLEPFNAHIPPDRLSTIKVSLVPLVREGRNITLQPIVTGTEFLLVTLHAVPGAPGSTLIVWTTAPAVTKPFEGLLSGPLYQAALINNEGRLLAPLGLRGPAGIARSPISDIAFEDPDQRKRLLQDLHEGRPGSGRGVLGGASYIFAHAPIPETGLRVITLLPLDLPAQGRAFSALRNYLVLSAALLFLTGVGALFLATGLTRSLRMLTTAVEEIGAGNLDAPLEVSGKDDVARLAASFRTMAWQIKEQFLTLEQRVEDRTRQLTLKSQELAQANEDLIRMSKMKSDFLAKMSHELRTPLNSIIGFTDLVLSGSFGQITDKQRDALGRVVRNAKNLLQLINDILDLSKIEADRLTLKLGPVNLKVLVDSAVGNLEFKAIEKNISLKAEVDPAIPTLTSDEVRLLQILNNLLANAVKFTHEGGVTLIAKLVGNHRVSIAVRDTGIGMDAKDLANLFTEFYQADTSLTRRYEGTGLGLAITKRLVEGMGGSITVESRPGAGSTFTVTLPVVSASPTAEVVTLPPAPKPAKAAPTTLEGKRRILIIDDDLEIHTLIAENLKDTGSEFLRALEGDEGLRLAREARPDVILLDIRMPNKDGWEVLHDLKANTVTAGIPVVIMSSVDNKFLGFSLGAADYLVKPVQRDELFRALARLLIGPGSGYILVVDDDYESVEVVKEALEVKHFTVAVAYNGKQALQAVKQRIPRLIVLDLMMPVMDGFEVVAQLRTEPATRDIPVVILTAKDLTQQERAVLDGKTQALFQKGQVSLNQLISDVQKALARPLEGM